MNENDFSALSELKDDKFHFDFEENKSYIYSVVFYLCGLILGSVIYKYAASETLNDMISFVKTDFFQLLISDFCLYFSVFLVTVFLGFCLIGFPLINLIPMACGTVIGLKIAYYYMNFGVKGIGYSLIMIIPAAALLLLIVSLTIKVSTDMSKSLFDISIKKDEMIELDIKSCIKKYLIFAGVILLTAVFDAGMTCVFSGVVTI